MAYGVKYRLDFSDVLSFGKRLEILKKNYSGPRNFMVGQAEPVVIRWNANDDYYNSPIVGSVCSLNLFTTDDVSYDNFYEYDEREYQVKISYKDSNNNYQTYWIGYLVVDRHIEEYKSNPVAFTLKAYDGLGTLDNYSTPLFTSPFNENTGIFNRTRIATILAHLDLDLDIKVQADITPGFSLSPTYPSRKAVMKSILITAGRNELINNFDVPTCKKQLEAILRSYNCRIFQSYGCWYIVENTNIFDYNVKNTIFTTLASGGSVSNIRTSIKNQLVSSSDEVIQTDLYNTSGVYQSSSNDSVLRIVPTTLKSIGSDLVREYIQPLNKARYNFKTTQSNVYQYTRNVGFEYGSYGWILSSYASLVTDETNQQGNKAIKLVNAPTSGETLVFNSDYVGQTAKGWNYYYTGVKSQIGIFVDKNENSVANFTLQFRIVASAPPNFYYWDDVNSTWTTTSTTITREIQVFNNWQTIDVSFDGTGYPTSLTNNQIGIQVLNCTYSGTGVEDIYFDNVGIIGNYFKPSGLSAEPNANVNIPNSYIEFAERNNSTLVFSDEKTITGTYYFNGVLTTDYAYHRTRDYNTRKPIFERHLQNIMNDYRDFVVRYEGTFRNEIQNPLSMHNRLWFNFGASIAQDEQSCFINGLEYKVKSANAKVIAHLPNDDDDIDLKFRITTE
jgi:hypothetical protein